MDIKNRILEKACELYFQYGVKNTSMDELAYSLGISKRTIYENFKDKEDILKSLILKIRDERNEELRGFMDKDLNAIEMFIKVIETQKKMPVSNAKFIQDIYKYYPNISKIMQRNIEQNNKSLQEFLEKG